MTMSKGLVSYIEGKVSELKVMCGLSPLESPACEERAIKAVKPDPIPTAKFMTVYRQRKRSGQLAVEFKAIHRNQDEHSTQAALRNVLLNNKQDVLPYDHSRVIILNPTELNDYYNASYIDGYNIPKEYIASQGPSTKNMPQFWHVVWQENVCCIVMATGLFENAMQQCDKYWVDHARNVAVYGNIKVWHEESTCLAQLNIRTFRIQKEGSCETRVLYQYEMVGLHEECPDSGLLLDVRRRVHAITHNQPGSVLVHCRCGGGRTAVYVALDYCLYQLQAEDRVDVYSAVLHLRRFRKNMVRTVSQYQQIYNAVAMYIQCGVTVFPSETLPSAYQLHYASCREGKSQKLDREFQTLQSIVPRLSIGDCASGHRVENRSKSRDIMMLPPECARPYLNTADCGDSGTDFINAVYVNGYHSLNRYLVTQWPMKRTLADVWRLLFDFKITSLVVMSDMKKFSRSYPRFWPKEVEQVINYGPISVRYISCERRPELIIRTFAIRKPKRHPHLVAQALVRISEDVMILNSLVGCELRRDELIVKMFQVHGAGLRGGKRYVTYNNTTSTITSGDPCGGRGGGGGGGGGGGDGGDGSRARCGRGRRNRHRRGRRHDSTGRFDTPEHMAGSTDGLSDDTTARVAAPWSKSSKSGHSLKGGADVPIQSKSLLAVMEHVEEWQQRSVSRQPVCVMSKNGSSEAGLFCTVSICCDQLKAEKEVDVFSAVRYVRSNRPQLIPTLEEYRFIYQFMAELIKLTKSKPDIIISKPFPALFASSDVDATHYLKSNSISSSIHGGVYVTKLEDRPGSNNSLTPGAYGTDTTAFSLPHSNSSSSHLNANCAKPTIGKANSYPLNSSSSISQMSSVFHEPSSHLNMITDPLSFPSAANQCSPIDDFISFPSAFSNHPPRTPDSIHMASFITAADITPNIGTHNNCSYLGTNLSPNLNQQHSVNGFLSPVSCFGHVRENHLSSNSSSSLCKSSSFYSCDSNLSDNINNCEDEAELYLSRCDNTKSLENPDDLVRHNDNTDFHNDLGSPAESYSTLKDFPTEDTSISFQLDGDNSPSNNTSCPSIVDSYSGATGATPVDLASERNNNCRKRESAGAQSAPSKKTDNNSKSRKDKEKKSKRDKWLLSFPKVLGWKKK